MNVVARVSPDKYAPLWKYFYGVSIETLLELGTQELIACADVWDRVLMAHFCCYEKPRLRELWVEYTRLRRGEEPEDNRRVHNVVVGE